MQTSLPEKSDFIRLTSAARYLGVKNITMRRWVRWGWFTGYRCGPQLIKVRMSDVRRLRKKLNEIENDMAGQIDTRLGSILRDSPELFGSRRVT